MNIILFDVDGVLIRPHGYHRALQDTVLRVGQLIGFSDSLLSADDIACFEAAGVSSEWDASAISTLLLMETAWKADPELLIPGRFDPIQESLALPLPCFGDFARLLGAPHLSELSPLSRARRLLIDANHRPSAHKAIMDDILRQARQPESLTFQIYQELIIGSVSFERLYGLQPVMNTESYLDKYDCAVLSRDEMAALMAWILQPTWFSALLTARPGEAPPPTISSPDAEIGAAMLGFVSMAIASYGKLQWLAERLGIDPQLCTKPSPIHALSALLLALGKPVQDSMESAADLVFKGNAGDIWNILDGARVLVFEDSRSGIDSLRAASVLLGQSAIKIFPEYYGISEHPEKITALRNSGAVCFPSLKDALHDAGIRIE